MQSQIHRASLCRDAALTVEVDGAPPMHWNPNNTTHLRCRLHTTFHYPDPVMHDLVVTANPHTVAD